MTYMNERQIIDSIVAAQSAVAGRRALLVAISGIDGAGKGYVTGRLDMALTNRGLRVAEVGIDGWLNLPHIRFDRRNPASNFYLNAFRFDEMFARLVLPLRDHRSIRMEALYTEETASAYRKHVYTYESIDVILLEGIFLLKREWRAHYDVSIWIECSFETALSRALARGQEGLPEAETRRAYDTIYFPAQRIHFRNDRPQDAATWTLRNEERASGRPRPLGAR